MRQRLRIGVWLSGLLGAGLTAGCPLLPIRPTGSASCGQVVWEANNCLTCHGQLGCGGSGPDIRQATFEMVDARLRAAGTAHTGGKRSDLSDQDLADLVAYLNSISDEECALSEVSARSKTANFAMIATHDPTSSSYGASCTTCHGARSRESALDGTTLAAHSVMPGRLGSGDQRCLTCHSTGVDFAFGTTSWLREGMITASGCAAASCHGASGPVPFYVLDQD